MYYCAHYIFGGIGAYSPDFSSKKIPIYKKNVIFNNPEKSQPVICIYCRCDLVHPEVY